VNSKIEVVLAEPADAEALADVSKRAFDSDIDVGAPGPGGPPDYDSVDAHRRDTLNERTDYWKVLFDEQIVGGTRVYKVSPEHCYIYGVFVDPDFHGRGIGTRFFEEIELMYPDAKKWSLDTPEWNPRTKGFYEKIGFVQTGILRWVPTFDLRYFVKITDDSYQSKVVPISELQEGMERLRVKGMVEGISDTRAVTSKDGKALQVAHARLVDTSGSVPLVLWNDQIRQVKKGEEIIIESGYVSSFKGEQQLSIARNGQVIITKPQCI
jgi:GNAT superfamily N-acetyltransferase